MKKSILIISLLLQLHAMAQENPTLLAQPIVAEGKRLYASEMASWYGTDLFVAAYKNRENIGGYFSYTIGDTSKCIFFSRAENPVVIGTIGFDSTYNVAKAKLSIAERNFTSLENDLYTIRKIALEAIVKDTLFKRYRNTNLNLIPLIYNNEKKLYVLTGPEQSGVVIFGNDYVIEFDAQNKIVSKKQLHRNLIPIEYGAVQKDGEEVVGAAHSHLPETGDFITATDICTLMLYEKIAKWKQHNVISAKYLNIWNCETNQLVVVPRDSIKEGNEETDGKH
ncbi:MAG: hypothetical protein JST81_12090 [Bacteroidetes bacterium]|nr:hypothetical protein [Bacteroidota bacterium]